MKRILTFSCALIISTLVFSQGVSFGPRMGLSAFLSSDLKIKRTFELNAGGQSIWMRQSNPTVQFGGFVHFQMDRFFVRPELLASRIRMKYETEGAIKQTDRRALSEDFYYLHVPVSFGYTLGAFQVFSGMTANMPLNPIYAGVEIGNVIRSVKISPFSFHSGAGIRIGRLDIDVNYERNFEMNECPSRVSILAGETEYVLASSRNRLMLRTGFHF